MESKRNGEAMLPIISNKHYTRIRIEDIQFVEQRDRRIHVVTVENREYVFYGKIENLVHLLAGKNFYRVLKKLVVNMELIESLINSDICFVSGIKYGLGKNSMSRLRKEFKKYICGYAPYGETLLNTGLCFAEESGLYKYGDNTGINNECVVGDEVYTVKPNIDFIVE